MCGGATALVCALILGPRIGRFHDRDGNPLDTPNDFAPHSVTLQMLGTFCLWFGWYGFNPGSALFTSSATTGGVAALAAVNTTLGACAGAVGAMFTGTIVDYFSSGYTTYDLTYAMNGCLTGLAAITAGCAIVETWAGVLIGLISGWTYIAASKLMIKVRIDDAVDAIPVHMFGGAWGLLSVGIFAKPELMEAAAFLPTHAGLIYGTGGKLLGLQCLGIAWVFSWSFVIMGIFFYALNAMGLLRVDPLEEEVGLDISRHKGACYDFSTEKNEDAVAQLHNSRHGMTEDVIKTYKKDDSDDAGETNA
jgi:ammonium transporter, Amt family